jgi:hypothetical protein
MVPIIVVDSSEMAFKNWSYLAFKKGAEQLLPC